MSIAPGGILKSDAQTSGKEISMKDRYYLGITDLLDQDLTSYEYFYALPPELQSRVFAKDAASFAEMQDCVEKLRGLE